MKLSTISILLTSQLDFSQDSAVERSSAGYFRQTPTISVSGQRLFITANQPCCTFAIDYHRPRPVFNRSFNFFFLNFFFIYIYNREDERGNQTKLYSVIWNSQHSLAFWLTLRKIPWGTEQKRNRSNRSPTWCRRTFHYSNGLQHLDVFSFQSAMNSLAFELLWTAVCSNGVVSFISDLCSENDQRSGDKNILKAHRKFISNRKKSRLEND